jgi:protoporphyrinogen oxidase
MKKKIAIIGAGPAGLTAAYLLAKEGVNVDVYEADSRVGGMAKSVPMWGQIVDLGPHRFFSSDPRVNKLWLSVIGKDYAMVSRLTRIFYRKKFYFYPLKPFNALFNLGIIQSIFCVLSYVKSKIFPPKGPVNFESWVVGRFGYRLYSIFLNPIVKNYGELSVPNWILTLLHKE